MTLGISGGRNSFYLSPASPLLSFRWLCPCEVHTCYLPGQFQQGLGLGIGEAIPFYSILSYPTHPISFHPLPAYPSHPSHPIPFHLISSHPSYSTPLQFSPSHPIPTHHQVLSTHCVLGGYRDAQHITSTLSLTQVKVLSRQMSSVHPGEWVGTIQCQALGSSIL